MFDKEKFGKILVPMVTPFQEDQSVDYDAAVSIAEKLIADNKADSIILTGTTGEFFTMTPEERVKMFKVLKYAVGDSIPLIAGTGAASTDQAVELSRAADELGFELLMVLSPYYTKPSQAELLQHFQTVAASINTNMILYNIPIFTGVNLEPATVAELAKIDNVVGIKEEAELHPKQMTDYMNCTPEDFVIYCGDDVMILEAFAQGGAKRAGGVVSGGSHLIGDKLRDMIDTFLDGNIQEAADMQRKFLPLFRSMGAGGRTNPCCLLKDAMRLMGYNSGLPRLPLLPGTEDQIAGVKKIMKELGLI